MRSTYEKEFFQIMRYFEAAAEELTHENRFSNEKLDKVVQALVSGDANAKKVRSGAVWKRARKYKEDDVEYRFANCAENQFQGYDKIGSFLNLIAPNEGRCNPQYIPYLYVSETESCCISELNPQIGEYISIANIRVNHHLKILELATDCMLSTGLHPIIPGIQTSTIALYLTLIFSKHHDDRNYLMTQYLAEKVKNNGYDGISFYSSAYGGLDRTNYTIFNFAACEAISSRLCKITDIHKNMVFDLNKGLDSQREMITEVRWVTHP